MKIVIWTGAAWEPWGPSSVDGGGIGGSETAAINMARELSWRGHEVVMFGEHQGFEGRHKHVGYRDHDSEFSSSVEYRLYQDAIRDSEAPAVRRLFVSRRATGEP